MRFSFFRKSLKPRRELSYDSIGARKRSSDLNAQLRDFHGTAQAERDRAELLTRATVAEQQVREQQEYIDTHLSRYDFTLKKNKDERGSYLSVS